MTNTINSKQIQEYDSKVEQIIKNNSKRIPAGIVPRLTDLLQNSLFSVHCRNTISGKGSDALELLDFLSDTNRDADISGNFSTATFIADFFPEISSNKALKNKLNMFFDLKQKGFGAGEALFFLLFPLCESSSLKTLDGMLHGEGIELKSATSAASIKAQESASFRTDKKLYESIFSKKSKGVPELWQTSTRDQWHNFFKTLYPNFYTYEKFDEVYDLDSTTKRQQMVGYLILCEYKRIDDIGKFLLIRPNKKGTDLEVVCVSDFEDKEFITKHIRFSPQVTRGKTTQAVGDGFADVKIMPKNPSKGKACNITPKGLKSE